jgi:spore coat polysaccharide biosynthesis protein SpsF
MRTLVIVQARMGSSRLPAKVIADVAGVPMLERVIQRALLARTVDQLIVATSEQQRNDVVAQLSSRLGIECFRGSEDDVLDRYYRAAKHFGATAVVRLTADCPLIDPAVIDKVVRVFLAGDYDYVSNTLEATYPDGLDTEAFSMEALEAAWSQARLTSEREHVTPYICRRPDLFRLANVKHDVDLSHLRWTVDEEKDLAFVRAIYGHLGSQAAFDMNDILRLLSLHPELGDINAGFTRNEGYLRSIREDSLAPSSGTAR